MQGFQNNSNLFRADFLFKHDLRCKATTPADEIYLLNLTLYIHVCRIYSGFHFLLAP